MERLEKLINILKLTPHHQPELVKEATHRILTRSSRTDPRVEYFLKPMVEILIQYCDSSDSAQRSIFNDHLNTVISTFQVKYYKLLVETLLDIVTNNGSARAVTAALQRIAHLITNVRPIELGCEPERLLKSLIEVARRGEDESIIRALETLLKSIMPFLNPLMRLSKEMQLLSNLLIELLLKNLSSESFQTQRLASSSLSIICSNNELLLNNTLGKLAVQIDFFTFDPSFNVRKFVGFCSCVKDIPGLAERHHVAIIEMVIHQIENKFDDPVVMNASLETLKELFKYPVEGQILDRCAKLLVEKFLISDEDGRKVMKKNGKIIFQSNALACISVILCQRPTVLDGLQSIFIYQTHQDFVIRNQIITMIGNYIEASWRFPLCADVSVDCERIRKLWVDIRVILFDDNSHPDTLKTCVTAVKSCINALLESDHCLHIVEPRDFDRIIHLYRNSTFKPLKVEILNLFATLNFRTLYYLERSHWYKMKAYSAGSILSSLQDKIITSVILTSLVDEHQRIRTTATSALVSMIPNLYVIDPINRHKTPNRRNGDPIVSLAHDLAGEHLAILEQANTQSKEMNFQEESAVSSELHEKLCIRNDHRSLSSSIIQLCDNPHNERLSNHMDVSTNQHHINISVNLMYIIPLLRSSIENSLYKGKVAISSIVRTLHELSISYPIHQYSVAWDCRPSEYCESFTLLNFLLSYLENLTEPDIVIEDLDSYRNFLAFANRMLYALCHESVSNEYGSQKLKPLHKRQAGTSDGGWSELSLKHPAIEQMLDVYFTHLTKLLWITSCIIEEKNSPFNTSARRPSSPPNLEPPISHGILASDVTLFNRIFRKLESSYKSSKKSLNQQEEKFFQILEICLDGISSLLEFIGMSKSLDYVKDILGHLKAISSQSHISSLICARQLLKSLFGINILALYQVDPNDWFEEESWPSTPTSLVSQQSREQETPCASLLGVYHFLVAEPYKIFSNYCSTNRPQITPTSNDALTILNFENRRSLKIRRRIEDRVKSLFEHNPHRLISPKMRQLSDTLKSTIIEFTPIVTESMSQFSSIGFIQYQNEILHFMSYLILLRVNYQKLAQAADLLSAIDKFLEKCGERAFTSREAGLDVFLRTCFTFLMLLTYERRPSKPMIQVASIIQKLDDLRAKLSMSSGSENDVETYIVPLLRCLVEDLFIYRTKKFQTSIVGSTDEQQQQSFPLGGSMSFELKENPSKDMYELLEAERETVAQKLLDVVDNPRVYDLLSILILESRQNSSEIKYNMLSRQLLSIIPNMLSKCQVNLVDYRSIELTRRIIENISPEVFQPVKFIFETLLETPKPETGSDANSKREFKRWMSLVIIAMHILITQVKEEVFLSRLHESMSDEVFVEYLMHIAQMCMSEMLVESHMPPSSRSKDNTDIVFLAQQLSSYMLYLTYMFQSGLFFQLSRTAADLIRRQIKDPNQGPQNFYNLCVWARDSINGFSLAACERMFYLSRLNYPDLTIFWCNLMMLLNNVDCNRDYWRDLLIYECHHCRISSELDVAMESLAIEKPSEAGDSIVDSSIQVSKPESGTKDESKFKRSVHVNRPASLNLSDISFSDQLRRSFIKKIASAEPQDNKAFNRNIIETSGADGQTLEQEVSIGNTEQCLSPNIELTRRGALCLVLDFVTISMNDVEHITWLIIHHINDIIRWSHESPITEFINAVHGNSASSGIFIQAINCRIHNLDSISYVTRLLWTLQQVHYTQYGSLVVLLVEKLLSAPELMPYISLTKKIEDFACSTVRKLINKTNRNLVTTDDEIVNQLSADDLNRMHSMLDGYLYPKLSEMLLELRDSTPGQPLDTPTIQLEQALDLSDEDSDVDELENLYAKANIVYSLCERNYTAKVSSLLPALQTIELGLASPSIVARLNGDEVMVCFLVSAIYSVALNVLPPPTRLQSPSFWSEKEATAAKGMNFGPNHRPSSCGPVMKPTISLDSKRPAIKATSIDRKQLYPKDQVNLSASELVELLRLTCLKGLFLVENMEYLRVTQFGHLSDIIVRLARLPLINSFVLTPPSVWRQNLFQFKFDPDDSYKIHLPMITHDILIRDYGILDNFCDRLLKLGWTSRRQFEEAWMTLLGVLTASLSPSQPEFGPADSTEGLEMDTRTSLLVSCKVVSTITKLLFLTRKQTMGDPLAPDSFVVQSFDRRVIDLTRSIASNLSSLRARVKMVLESLEPERRSSSSSSTCNFTPVKTSQKQSALSTNLTNGLHDKNQNTAFSHYLQIPAQKLRMNAILNVEVDMQDTVVIDSETSRNEDIDVESCIRLLLSIYKQKLKDPNEILFSSSSASSSTSSSINYQQENRIDQQQVLSQSQSSGASSVSTQTLRTNSSGSSTSIRQQQRRKPSQLAPPMASAIAQSILALSDMFVDYEQFEWMFDSFVQMFRLAERNEDEIQRQYLIVGLCKSASICCYEIPNELAVASSSQSAANTNHRDVMFEKCRQSLDKCIKSDFGPLKVNALFGAFYMLEDSINIVASGAWELDHFKVLRLSRLNWIMKLMPIILDRDNFRLLTRKAHLMRLLESLCEVVTESEIKTIKA